MRVISRLEDAAQLDPAVNVGQRAARSIRPGRIRDALHGVWLGHPLHPVLVQLPVGAWLSASALDRLAPRADAAARRLVAAGLVASAPAFAAGAVDWSEQHVVAVRNGDRVQVLADRCSHMSGPLSAGELANGCLTCPWHGSVFRLADGSVARSDRRVPQSHGCVGDQQHHDHRAGRPATGGALTASNSRYPGRRAPRLNDAGRSAGRIGHLSQMAGPAFDNCPFSSKGPPQ